MTAEHRSAFLAQLRNIVDGNKAKLQHPDLQQTRIQKDAETAATVCELIQGWINPFTENQDLLSISTARKAPREVASDLMKAHDIGQQCYSDFKDQRLEKDPPVKKFHDPIALNKLKSFSSLCKRKQVKSSGRVAILKADRSLFGRIIVMAQGRNLKMEDILSHPLGPLPWALSTPDGLLRKTNKAALATSLQSNVAPIEQLPDNFALIIDGMSLVQKVKGEQTTFGDVATAVLQMVLREGKHNKRIDVVFDTYKENSIKNSERLLRGEETSHQFQSIASTQIVRQWRNFLSRTTNKTSLIAFLVSEWKSTQHREQLELHQRNACKSHVYSVIKKKLMDAFCYMLLMQQKMDIRL
ncbi:uncharacterized protein [Dysidea avara]|uniref:uncharacterized protein n=1 Tax=Dysidea avara TaxID=196820 RepID=UPI00331EE3D8